MHPHTKALVNVGTNGFKGRTGTCETAMQCRWTSTSSSAGSDIATLPDGRKIGFARYGASDGPKVFVSIPTGSRVASDPRLYVAIV